MSDFGQPDYGEMDPFDQKVRTALKRILADPYDSSFNKQLTDAVLTNPMDHPSEFKGWMVSYLESSNLQLPFSQVVGNFLTETTTSDLGGNVHGRVGMVRGGASPFDFFQMTYDDVFGKWVSNFIVVMGQPTTFSAASVTYVEVTNTQDFIVPYESFFNAGIKPQFRLMAQLDNSGAGTTTVTVLMGSFDTNEAITAATEPSWNISLAGTSEAFKDTGWQDHPALTVKDFMVGAAVLKASSGTGSVTGLTMYTRWVSQ